VAEEPEQIVDEVTETLGIAFTLTVVVLVCEQPEAFVPLTVYVVFAVGETEIVDVVAPVFQEYVVAPLAVNTVDVPAQIVAEVTATVGEALIVNVRVVVLELVPLDATKVTVLTPVDVNVNAAFVAVLVAGVAPVVVHV